MKRLLSLILLMFALSNPVAAQDLSGVAQVEILPGWRDAGGQHTAGIRIVLAPGWKTYWRAPGDAGIPPVFDWFGSENLNKITPAWPTPEVFRISGIRSIGYQQTLVVPLTIETRDADAPVRLKGRLMIGVCEEICVPTEFEFDVSLPAGGGRDSQIIAAIIDRPKTAQQAGVGQVSCIAAPMTDGIRLTATVQMPVLGPDEEMVIEAGDPLIWVSEPDISRQGNQLTASADLFHVTERAFGLDRSAIRITILAKGAAVDIRGCPAP